MYSAPSGYGGSATMGSSAQRDRITQALMNIANPPPTTQMPQQMGPPLAGQNQPAAFPGAGMSGAMPGAPTAAQPMGGAPAPMMPGAAPPVAMPGGGMPQPMQQQQQPMMG